MEGGHCFQPGRGQPFRSTFFGADHFRLFGSMSSLTRTSVARGFGYGPKRLTKKSEAPCELWKLLGAPSFPFGFPDSFTHSLPHPRLVHN